MFHSSLFTVQLVLLLEFTWMHDFQVQSFFSALKALSRKEVHYGAYATTEQVVWNLPFSFELHEWPEFFFSFYLFIYFIIVLIILQGLHIYMQINIPFIHYISFMYFMNKLIERRRKRGENSEIYKEYLLSSKDRLACLSSQILLQIAIHMFDSLNMLLKKHDCIVLPHSQWMFRLF